MTRPTKQTDPVALSSNPDGSRKSRRQSAFNSLTPDQRRAWTAFMRVRLRLTYEMNRQLQADSNLSLPDYDVLIALRYAPRGQMQITELAAGIGWERSRLSHHSRRLESRGLVELRPATSDRRATEITLTELGWDEITFASHGHVELIRHMFFDGVPDGLLEPLAAALESVYERLVEHGTLPPPSDQS